MPLEFCSDLTASSAVNLPITCASLRMVVIWIGDESTRCTYWGARAPPRFTFTRNLMFFIFISLSEKRDQRMAMQRRPVSAFPHLPLWDASHATLQAARIESRCDQSARRTHSLRSKPDGLRFQPAPPGQQQDREQHDQHTERDTGCVHKKRPFVASTASPSQLLNPRWPLRT